MGLLLPQDSTFKDEAGQAGVFIPKLPASNDGSVIHETPSTDTGFEDDPRRVTQSLKGLVFIHDLDAINTQGDPRTGIHIENIPELDNADFIEDMQAYLGKPVTLDDLDAISKATVMFMRANNRPVVDAIIPEQNVSEGTIQVLVLVGKLGKLATENNRFFDDELLLKHIRTQPGELIQGNALMADLRWINQNPFRQTDLVYSRGDHFGETDIILRTLDRKPVRVYSGYENNGTHLTGYDRWFAGVNWGNAFGKDHLLNYQFTFNNDINRLNAHSFSYFIPLESRHKLWFFGSYSQSNASLPSPIELKGTSWRLSSRYIIPLERYNTIEHEVTLGLDLIDSTNDLIFASTVVSNTPTRVAQAILGYGLTHQDAWGRTQINTTLRISPGGFSNSNTDEAFQRSRANTSASYAYLRMDAERATRLPWKFAWVLKARAQKSNERLISSEQLGFGGSSTIRGYETNEINSDEGIMITNELHSLPLSPIKWTLDSQTRDTLVGVAFWDYGYALNKDPIAGEVSDLFLSSVGAGLRYNYGAYLSATCDWGFQLKDSGNSPTQKNSRFEMSVTASY